MSTEPLHITVAGKVATLTLHRPDHLNAFNEAMRRAFIARLAELNADEAIRAVVLTGAGPRAFCAGMDLEEAKDLDWTQIASRHHGHQAVYQAVRDLTKPCVAALNGVTAGAGFQVALCADWRVAAPEIRLGQPEVKVGIASIVGSYFMTQFLSTTHNVQMSLSGELVSGQRGYEIGLVTELAGSAAEVLPAAQERAARLAELPAHAIRLTKERFRALTQPGFEAACTAGIRAQLECYARGEPQAAMEAFFEQRRTRARP